MTESGATWRHRTSRLVSMISFLIVVSIQSFSLLTLTVVGRGSSVWLVLLIVLLLGTPTYLIGKFLGSSKAQRRIDWVFIIMIVLLLPAFSISGVLAISMVDAVLHGRFWQSLAHIPFITVSFITGTAPLMGYKRGTPVAIFPPQKKITPPPA